MAWDQAKDVVLLLFSVAMVLLYIFREPYFLYPTVALTLTGTWEAMGWNGWMSLVTLIVVASLLAMGVIVRLMRGQRTFARDPISLKFALVVTIGTLSGALMLVGIPLTIASS